MMKIIPSEGKNTANYWCSWRNQRLFLSNPIIHLRQLDAPKHMEYQRDQLNDDFLFGSLGLVSDYMQDIRRDMYVLLDDGWDVPYRGSYEKFGSLVLNEKRFPYGGATPAENLKILNEKVLALGYAGCGLWVPVSCADEYDGARFTVQQFAEYWTERMKWLGYAGIAYLKADWGIHCGSTEYREIMTDLARRYAPHLQIEHAILDGWFFDDTPAVREQQSSKLQKLLSISDCFRCYDVVLDFNTVTTLARAATMLTCGAAVREDCRGFINVGEEPTVAAALGCTMGIMSHPLLRGSAISITPTDFRNGISHRVTRKSEYHNFDCYTRALRWQRLAPAYSVKGSHTVLSKNKLTDTWTFEKEPYPYHHTPTWIGQTVVQSAPQFVARDTVPPVIDNAQTSLCNPYEPYVAASVNPLTGVFTGATLPRTIDGVMNVTIPAVPVTFREVPDDKPFALFGEYAKCTLQFRHSIEGKRLFGADILADEAEDITDKVHIEGNTLTFDGEFLTALGTQKRAFRDLSDPASCFMLV